MAEIIAIANQKGGVGKTTTSINLAYALACLNQETLLVDLDPQANATSGLGVSLSSEDKTLYDVITGNVKASQALKQTSMEWLDIIPSVHDLAGAEIELVDEENREYCLKNALAEISDMYKFIVIDCPPSLSILTLNALTAANSIIIPVQSEYYAMEGLAYFLDTVSKVQTVLNPSLNVDGAVLTMFDNRMNLSGQVKEEVTNFFKDKIYRNPIPRNIRLAEAPSFGQSIFSYDPACKGAIAYFNFAVEFLTRRGLDASLYENVKPFASPEEEFHDYDLGG